MIADKTAHPAIRWVTSDDLLDDLLRRARTQAAISRVREPIVGAMLDDLTEALEQFRVIVDSEFGPPSNASP